MGLRRTNRLLRRLQVVFKLRDFRVQLVVFESGHNVPGLHAVADLDQIFRYFAVRLRVYAGLAGGLHLSRAEHRLFDGAERRRRGLLLRLRLVRAFPAVHAGQDDAHRQRAQRRRQRRRARKANRPPSRPFLSQRLPCGALFLLHRAASRALSHSAARQSA